jgi:hypothetical protein
MRINFMMLILVLNEVILEYQFNCLITLLKIDFNNESFLSDLFESLILKE